MTIGIPGRLSKFCERVIFLVMCFLVAVLFLVALEELGPFYGYGLDSTIVGVMAQTVSDIHGTMFQFSRDLYILYTWTWTFVVAAVCLMGLLALYLGFFFSLRLKKKCAGKKLIVHLEGILAQSAAQGPCRRLVVWVKEVAERLKRKQSEKVTSEEVSAGGKKWKTYVWQISLILIVALVIFMYRYALFPVPQGWDTPYYIYMIRSMQQDLTLLARLPWPRILSLALMYVATAVSGLTAEQTTVLLTPLIGIIYMVGVYVLVLTGTKRKTLAILAAIYTPLALGTIILSAGFYSNYLAWAFAMYALASYIKATETQERKLKYIVVTSVFLTLTALSHVWTFVFLTTIVLVHNLLEILANREYGRTIERTLVIYSPFIIFAVIQPTFVIGAIYVPSVFASSTSWAYASGENPYLLVLAITGVIAILNRKGTAYTRMVISWTIVTSTVLITGVSHYLYRIMPLVPIAILAAHGTQAISNGIIQHLNSKSIGKSVLPLAFLLCFTAIVPYTNIPNSLLTPQNEAMQQLYWIEQHFGFNNYSTIVCFDKIPLKANGLPYSNSYQWGIATIGRVIYDASVLYLIQGLADSHGNRFQDFAGKTIIIPDRFYKMDTIENKSSRRISDLGIYEFQLKSIAQIDQAIRNESIWLEDDFEKDAWKPNPPSVQYDYQVTNESGIMNVSVIPLHSYSWFDVETQLPALVYPKSQLILKVKGNIDSLLFEVDVYSNTGLLRWKDFPKYITPENYTYLEMSLPSDQPVSRIRLSLYSGEVIGIESYFQVDYIALI